MGLGLGHAAGPAQVQVTGAAGPGALVVAAYRTQALLVESRPRIQHDINVRGMLLSDDLAEHHDAVPVARMDPLDRWALGQAAELIRACTAA